MPQINQKKRPMVSVSKYKYFRYLSHFSSFLEKLKIEFEAQTILLKHEITNKTEQLDRLLKETETQKEIIKQLQQQLKQETQEVRRRCI